MKLARSLHERDFMMKRCAFILALVAGTGLCVPVQALAPAITSVTCEVTKISSPLGEATYDGTDDIGYLACDTSVLTFVVSGPANTSYQKYVGENCSSESKENCDPIETEDEIGGLNNEDEFEITVKDLLGYYDVETCVNANKTVRIYIFPEGQTTGEECTPITVDTIGPAVPTNLKGESGENEIEISWDKVEGDDDESYKYAVAYKIVDDCEAFLEEVLDALGPDWESDAYDAPPLDELLSNPVLQEFYDGAVYDTETAQGDDHTLEGVAETGEELMVTVAAIDKAGNWGRHSLPICVRVVETYGFCDSTDSCEDACSVGPIGKARAHTGAGVVLGLLTLFALVWAGRRSRR